MKASKIHILPALFVVLLTALSLLLLFLPRTNFSILEKRYLSDPPAFSMEGGQFSENMESYLGDHFPLRDQWVHLNAVRRFLLGLSIHDQVWLQADSRLVEAPLLTDRTRFNRNLAFLSDFATRSGSQVILVTPPSAGAVSMQKQFYPYPDTRMLEELEKNPPKGIHVVPLLDAFSKIGTTLFYRTDPHWNAEGVYEAYRHTSASLGFEPMNANRFTYFETPGFYGSNYARAGLWSVAPETLAIQDVGIPLTLRFDYSSTTFDSLFFPEHLNQPDKYPVFLDGNHGLTEIVVAGQGEGRSLLVLKDSFGNSLVPLLVPHFNRITVIDLRAFRGSVLELAAENRYDQVMAVYSLHSLTMDQNFSWLSLGSD